tara:strand:- start:56 stop:373 length:318 start_codon:yes stop_codon:yes gene_type:complete
MKIALYEIKLDNGKIIKSRYMTEITDTYNKYYDTDFSVNQILFKLRKDRLFGCVEYKQYNLYDFLKDNYDTYVKNHNLTITNRRTLNRVYGKVYNEYIFNHINNQ